MLGVLIKYKENSLFMELPKNSRELKDELDSIGLNMRPDCIKLSKGNDFRYTVRVMVDNNSMDIKISEKISNTDTLGTLNNLMWYIDFDNSFDVYEAIIESCAESITELYQELTAPLKVEPVDKLVIKTNLNYGATYYEPSDCVVEKVISLPTEEFQHLLNEPLDSYDFIKDNRMIMYSDENEVEHCILVYDEENGDGLLINAEVYDYARYKHWLGYRKGADGTPEIVPEEVEAVQMVFRLYLEGM